LKLGDIAGLLHLSVEERRWDYAFLLLAAHSQLKDLVYLPYAKWLLSQDRCAAWRLHLQQVTHLVANGQCARGRRHPVCASVP
jgi:hypothetical protein